MSVETTPLTVGSGTSIVVRECQICQSKDLEQILFLGYLPPVNKMHDVGQLPHEQPSYPALLLHCQNCQLVQIGLIVDPQVLFPVEYPYTSGTTKILRENFVDLYKECTALFNLKKDDLVVDIGSNDGTLLSNFASYHRVQGITPEDIGHLAIERGIPTIQSYFNHDVVQRILKEKGQAKIITATNVFAHIENIHDVVGCLMELLDKKGIFISESHYLLDLIETLQYDTIYHEHLRYYSLHSLQYLLNRHGLEVIHVKRIPTHGGSIRVYAARKGVYPVRESVSGLLKEEQSRKLNKDQLANFKSKVVLSKLALHQLLLAIKEQGKRIVGIGAPSRASTLINYAGLDDGILDAVLEIKGSYKIGKYIPGTLIPVEEESKLYKDQPDYALLLSWHIAEELAPKIKAKGFKGDFIVPLPEPHVIRGSQI